MAGTATQEKRAAATAAPWAGFRTGLWQKEINVRDFIQQNYEPYDGDASFLTGRDRTHGRRSGARSTSCSSRRDERACSTSRRFPPRSPPTTPGYIDRENEIIVGLQTEAPLKRAIMPNGGLRMVLNALKAYGYEPDPHVVEAFTKYRKTHNEGVFDAYTADVRRCRSSHILTGLPDAYGRGRIIGDYRRVALYGVTRLVERKQEEKNALDSAMSTDEVIRDREELAEQIRALKELQKMASAYGFDISGPANNAKEAVQWLYFGYLAGVKEQNGAAMSLGRTSTFLDIYFARDLAAGMLDRATGAGDRRRLRHQAAHRPVPAHARVRRAVRRRSDVGHRVDRRDGRRWPLAGDEDQLPLPADAVQPRSGAGTEPHDLVFAAPARWIQALRRQGRHRDQLDPVRERRDDAARVGRRRGRRLLRVADGDGQADAVLRRPRQPRQVSALRDQWRPRRGQRRPGGAGLRTGHRATCSTSTMCSTSSSG